MLHFGPLNLATIDFVLREAMRQAIRKIRSQRLSFTAYDKPNIYKDNTTDIVTSADQDAQQIYIQAISQCFPDWGIIAEENELRKPTQNDIWITIDPVDGTRAFARKQSHGVGTMVAVLAQEKIQCAYVGNVMTQDIFGFRADQEGAIRWLDFDFPYPLQYQKKTIDQSAILISNRFERYPQMIKNLIRKFRYSALEWDSIGIRFTKLWAGEAQALLFNFKFFTPWDAYPILGISQHLGFQLYQFSEEKTHLLPYTISLDKEPKPLEQDLLMMHPTLYEETFAERPSGRS